MGGELTFNFEATNQTAEFTIENMGGITCLWSDNSIFIDGTTEVNLADVFPMTVNGYTVNFNTNGQSGDLTVEGDFSSITFDACELAVTDLCITKDAASIDDLSDNLVEVSLYPNPATNIIQIAAEADIDAFTIYSITGEDVISKEQVSSNTMLVDISDLEKGMYLVKIMSNGKLSTVTLNKM